MIPSGSVSLMPFAAGHRRTVRARERIGGARNIYIYELGPKLEPI